MRIEGAPIGGVGDKCIICPLCKETYVHTVGVRAVTSDKAYGVAKFFESGVKGDLYVTDFVSECGSEFSVIFGFHKGMTFVHTFVHAPCHGPDDEVEPPTEPPNRS